LGWGRKRTEGVRERNGEKETKTNRGGGDLEKQRERE
jgi:hypothetical protein